jgi:hypothetical protein
MGILLGYLRSLGIDVAGAYQVEHWEDHGHVQNYTNRDSYYLAVSAGLAERVMAEIRKYGIERDRHIEFYRVNL